eukprot:9029543-Pyramimonas_sp.AAC.1
MGRMLRRPTVPRNILLHWEPCGAHGVALVKNRPKAAKDILRGASTFSALTRQWRFASALRDEVVQVTGRRVRVVRAPMPDHIFDKNMRILSLLFGDMEADFMYTKDRTGHRVQK